MKSLRMILDEKDKIRRQRLTPMAVDGVFIRGLKRLLGWNVFNWAYFYFARMWLRRHLDDDYEARPHEAEQLIRDTIDYYQAAMILCLLGSYLGLYWTISLCEVVAVQRTVAFLAISLCIYRIGDIYAAFLLSFSGTVYRTIAPMRTVSNAFCNYVELIISFATFYLFAAYCGDSFADGKTLMAHWFTPVYFSFATITTLGYGDYAPQTFLGKVFVACQVTLGLILLAVILQRVLSVASAPIEEGGKGPQC
jgi:hypothetical protein